MRHRVAAILLREGKILLMHRLKEGKDYYVFPGGGIEEGETVEEALKREAMEELSLVITKWRPAFELEHQSYYEYGNNNRGYIKEHYFYIEDYSGAIALGGPEKEKMNETNQYILEWKDIGRLGEIANLYPYEAVRRLAEQRDR